MAAPSLLGRRVVFRADASHALGFGHVARLWALIEEVQSAGGDPVLMFGGDALAVMSWARDRNLEVDAQDWSPEQVARAAEEMHAAAVVIDGPAIADQLAPKLKDRGVRTVVVDDQGKCPLQVDAVVNHNFHALSLAHTYPCAKRKLLGRHYLMLRREIKRFTRGSCRPMASSRLRLLITFGGSDPVGATARVISLLPEDRPLELVVIAGPGFRDDDALRIAVGHACLAGHTVDVRRSPDDPGGLFVSADAALCSAGGTLGELAYLGVPALAWAIARDQVVPAREQVRKGMISGGRKWTDCDDDMIRADLVRFLLDDAGRAQQRLRALGTADSDGANRVLHAALLGTV